MLELPHRFGFDGQDVAWGVMGEGPPLVLVHGTPFSSQVWRRIAPALAQRHRVHYFDLLGYGASAKSAGQDVSLGVQNRVLAALLAEWRLQRPVVVCHDFGGATALRAHYIDGIVFEAMVAVDPVAIAPWGSPFVQHVRRHVAAFEELPAAFHDALLRAYLEGASHLGLRDEAAAIYMAPWQGEVGQPAFYRQIAQMDQAFTDEIEPRYGAMPFPVTLIWGEEDRWIPVAQGRRLAGLLEGARFVPVAGAGHLVQEDAPEAIVAEALTVAAPG